MKKLVALLFISTNYFGQNWNLFNKSYRYNYKYNYSLLITQVMFADSVKLSGNDTVYFMNRIGVECTGSCPTLTSPITNTTVIVMPNMPQFLQRNLKKLQNGLVILKDTATLVINPYCQPNQTWLFDSINNINALCLNKVQQSVFGINDSVKNILVNGTDTLKISKRFGILQFPELYNKNKYYRLAGIENANSYEVNSLYGIKVPNAWDIYNFDNGDQFCYKVYDYYNSSGSSCYKGNYTITGKTITATGYQYSVNDVKAICDPGFSNTPVPAATGNLIFTTNSSTILVNQMYPGQLIKSSRPLLTQEYNIVKFGTDNKGTFYKHAGGINYSMSQITFPFNSSTAYSALIKTAQNYLIPVNSAIVTEVFAEGLGHLNYTWANSIYDNHYTQISCAVKNGQTYLGNADFIGLSDSGKGAGIFNVYPNPNHGVFKVNLQETTANEIKMLDVLGKTVEVKPIISGQELLELNISDQPRGIYFIQVFENGNLTGYKKVVKN